MSNREALSASRFLHTKTKGKPYAFVIMDYKSRHAVFKEIKRLVEANRQMMCLRADEVVHASQDLLAKLHLTIQRAEIVVADLSTESPNVFYEVGYATALQKDIVFLRDAAVITPVPVDLRGKEMILYQDTEAGLAQLSLGLRSALKSLVNSEVALLRDMLEGPQSKPAYIVASPKYPKPGAPRLVEQVFDYRTYGDNLGIRGLVSAFGALFGEGDGVELISAQYRPPKLVEQEVNLYLIGSAKVNPVTEELLPAVQPAADLRWELSELPERRAKWGEKLMQLKRIDGNGERIYQARRDFHAPHKEPVVVEDYGLVIRAPHPRYPNRIVLITAGAHSLGSGAACVAATHSPLVREIKQSLLKQKLHLSNKQQPFWVLVKGKASKRDGLLDAADVQIVETGTW